jgi:SRSO17 transposase
LVVALIDIRRGIALPLGYVIVAKEGEPAYKPAHKLAREILSGIVEEGFPGLAVSADSWFDSVEFMVDLEKIGLTFAGEIKGNKRVKPCPSPKVSWRSLPDIFLAFERLKARSRFDSKAVTTGKSRLNVSLNDACGLEIGGAQST